MHACRHRLGPDQRQPSLGPALPPAMPRRHPRLAPLPASLGLRFRTLLGLGFVPPPGPSPAPIAPPSPTRCSRLPASLYVAIEQIQNRRLGRCHREVPPASPPSCPPRAAIRIPLCRHRADPALIAPPSRPPCADIRIAPHLSPRVAAAPGP